MVLAGQRPRPRPHPRSARSTYQNCEDIVAIGRTLAEGTMGIGWCVAWAILREEASGRLVS